LASAAKLANLTRDCTRRTGSASRGEVRIDERIDDLTLEEVAGSNVKCGIPERVGGAPRVVLIFGAQQREWLPAPSSGNPRGGA